MLTDFIDDFYEAGFLTRARAQSNNDFGSMAACSITPGDTYLKEPKLYIKFVQDFYFNPKQGP